MSKKKRTGPVPSTSKKIDTEPAAATSGDAAREGYRDDPVHYLAGVLARIGIDAEQLLVCALLGEKQRGADLGEIAPELHDRLTSEDVVQERRKFERLGLTFKGQQIVWSGRPFLELLRNEPALLSPRVLAALMYIRSRCHPRWFRTRPEDGATVDHQDVEPARSAWARILAALGKHGWNGMMEQKKALPLIDLLHEADRLVETGVHSSRAEVLRAFAAREEIEEETLAKRFKRAKPWIVGPVPKLPRGRPRKK